MQRRTIFKVGYLNLIMDSSNLFDYQLYEIIQNEKLTPAIRQAANEEFNRRKLSLSQIRKLIARHDTQFPPKKEEGLKIQYKILLVICPIFIVIHGLIAGRMLAMGEKQKWKEYWIYICLGYITWTVAIILFAKYFLFRGE